MTSKEKIQSIQTTLGVTADGDFGPKSQAALDALKLEAKRERNASLNPETRGKASSFADPADIAAFKKAKAKGMTDTQAFKFGDNGIGAWGEDTTANKPMCALPREDWSHLKKPNGTPVEVTANGKTIICALADTMPAKKNIKNGAVIDLNPAASKALGLKPPFLVAAAWRWA